MIEMKKHSTDKGSEFDKSVDSLGLCLGLVNAKWRKQVETALAELDLTHPQFVVLMNLERLTRNGSALKQIEVARHCKLDAASASQLVRTLERKEFVEREKRQGDNRTWVLVLTKSGRKALEKAIPILEEVDKDFFKKIRNDSKLFLECLQRLSEDKV